MNLELQVRIGKRAFGGSVVEEGQVFGRSKGLAIQIWVFSVCDLLGSGIWGL